MKATFPDWVLAQKQKGTEVRHIKGHYYLYKITSKWNKDKKRPVKITEGILGRITETGLITSTPRVAKRHLEHLSVMEFGLFDYLYQTHQNIIKYLKVFFPDYHEELFLLAIFRLAYHSPLKNIDFYYQNSYANQVLVGAKLNDKALTKIFREVGAQRSQIANFLKALMLQDSHFLVDQTHIVSFSDQMQINRLGYNSQRVFDPQVNLLFIFAAESKTPCFYRLLSGDIREVKALQQTLLESGLENVMVVGDKGFYSAANAIALEKEELKYILPLKRNHPYCDYTSIAKGGKEHFDGYFSFKNRIIWYKSFTKEDSEQNTRNLILFLDNDLKNEEEKDYLLRIKDKKDGYTIEKFHQKQESFGTITITHNTIGLLADKIFEYFKSRNEIEVMIDAYKNTVEADKTYMQGQNEMETWSFVNFISLIMYYGLYNQLLKKEMLKKYSPKDILLFLQNIRKIKIGNDWVNAEITVKSQKIIDLLRN